MFLAMDRDTPSTTLQDLPAPCHAAVIRSGPAALAEEAPDGTAHRITRGVRRFLWRQGGVSVCEVTLRSGRRADVMALLPDGDIWIVEVKSSRADFVADGKWPEYQPFCDRFFFAVADGFPIDLLPDDVGVLVADAFDATMLRPAPLLRLHASRRRAITLLFARAAAARLHRLEDPHQALG